MVFGDEAKRILEVRKLAGRLSSHLAPDNDVIPMLEASDAWLVNKTGNSKWDDDTIGFALGIKASNYIAAAELINSQSNGDTDKANGLRVAARDFTKGINFKDTEVQGKGTGTVSAGYDIHKELDSRSYMKPLARDTDGEVL